jgi:predicted dehydrogenase
MSSRKQARATRRRFLKDSLGATAGVIAAGSFPLIVPSSVFGKASPSNRINVAAIGTGRISRIHDIPEVLKNPLARIMAVCDLDSKRASEGRDLVNALYEEQTGKPWDGVRVYTDYRELLQNSDIDAVLVSTPDHWHAPIGVHAVQAGKDVYLQKPASLTIADGRTLSDAVAATDRIMQIGSQQRSWEQFRVACELVRNGVIGELQRVYVGLPGDPAGDEEPEMPVPANLNYDMWLGCTPEVYYTEKRVHPQNDYGRPGWLRCEQFGAGMITGWGAHHVDTAHWGMDTEYTGPLEIWGQAEFPKSGLWDVHGIFRTEALYANGVHMTVSNEIPNGIRFEGSEGWIFVTRGNYRATDSDPVADENGVVPLSASDPRLLHADASKFEVRLPVSDDHHGNWLQSVISREPPIAPIEIGHRSCSACLLHHMAMKVDRHLHWNPDTERFVDDPEADGMLSRPHRAPWLI